MGSASARLIRELQSFRRRVEGPHPVKKMILFGSRARGRPRKDSDVDLIVVSPTFRRRSYMRCASTMYALWDLDYAVDFLCYTPEEFRELSRRPSIVQVALREGVSIPP